MEPNQTPYNPQPQSPEPPSPLIPNPPAPAPVQPSQPFQPPATPTPVAAPTIPQTYAPTNSTSPPPPPYDPNAPLPTVTVGDGGMPVAPSTPAFGAASTSSPLPSKRKFPKKILGAVLAVILLVGIPAAYYFGYYMNPSVIYSQSLANTGKGYDKLITYADQQSQLGNKGYSGSGTYSIKTSGSSIDGSLGFKSTNTANSDLTFDVGISGTRINADIRTIKSSGTTPDLYIKVGNIKGLGTLAGEPAYDPELAKLDNQWIVVDHTLLDSLVSAGTATNSGTAVSPTRDQVLDEARAFGRVNQQYVFSTAKDKAITTVVKKYGIENVDGHKTYHYKIALQKDNVKKYILAQEAALKASSLNDWLTKNKYDKSVYSSFDDALKSANDIKSSDTFDIWTDVNHRLVYKLRVDDTSAKNPAENYVDVGLDYKGGDNFPFFIAGQNKDSGETLTYSFVAAVNTSSSTTDLKFNLKADGSDNTTVTSDFNFKPNTTAPVIAKPANAIPFTQVMSDVETIDATVNSSSAAAASYSADSVDLGQLQTDFKLSASGKPATSAAKTSQTSLLKQLLDR